MEKQNIIKWIQGNDLKLAIPLQRVIMTKEGKIVEKYIPQEGDVITFELDEATTYWRNYVFTPIEIVDDNVIIVLLDATLPRGTYNVTINIKEVDGTPRRSKWDNIVYIYDTNEEVMEMYDDFPDYAEGQVVEGVNFYFAKGDSGDDGVGIASIEQISESHESGGENVIRITLTNGETYDFTIRNGNKPDIEVKDEQLIFK